MNERIQIIRYALLSVQCAARYETLFEDVADHIETVIVVLGVSDADAIRYAFSRCHPSRIVDSPHKNRSYSDVVQDLCDCGKR